MRETSYSAYGLGMWIHCWPLWIQGTAVWVDEKRNWNPAWTSGRL